MYSDRRSAGRLLARELQPYRSEHPIVIGLTRGGVPVAEEVARELGAPLEILIVRKLGVPGHVELGMGAIAEGGGPELDQEMVAELGISIPELRDVIAREAAEVVRRGRLYRGERPMVSLAGRTVLLVDDGIATGGTVRAALRAIRARGAARVILAAPVAEPSTLARLAGEADEIVVPLQPDRLRAVGLWYERFDQTSDDEVMEILDRAHGAARTEPAQPW